MADDGLQHGDLTPADRADGNRAIHPIAGFNSVLDEAALAALLAECTPDDRNRVVEQTGGDAPGLYYFNGSTFKPLDPAAAKAAADAAQSTANGAASAAEAAAAVTYEGTFAFDDPAIDVPDLFVDIPFGDPLPDGAILLALRVSVLTAFSGALTMFVTWDGAFFPPLSVDPTSAPNVVEATLYPTAAGGFQLKVQFQSDAAMGDQVAGSATVRAVYIVPATRIVYPVAP